MVLGKRLYAWFYHDVLSKRGHPDLDDPFTRDVRIPLLRQANGAVLEIGAGNGSNLPLYLPDIRLTLLDPNPFMLHYLRHACTGRDDGCPPVIEGTGEHLPFPDSCFDTVVTTHVLCSVHNQARVLSEIRRVLRPGGSFLFLEHVSADVGTALYRFQRLLNPAWRFVGGGCHLTRDTGQAIREAGFREVAIRTFKADFPALVSPHIVGMART